MHWNIWLNSKGYLKQHYEIYATKVQAAVLHEADFLPSRETIAEHISNVPAANQQAFFERIMDLLTADPTIPPRPFGGQSYAAGDDDSAAGEDGAEGGAGNGAEGEKPAQDGENGGDKEGGKREQHPEQPPSTAGGGYSHKSGPTPEGLHKRKLTIAFISDTHNRHGDIKMHDMPYADMLLHTGDMTDHGKDSEWKSVNEWFGKLKSEKRNKKFIRREF